LGKWIYTALIFLLISCTAIAQADTITMAAETFPEPSFISADTGFVYIRNITISGNKKTKPYIIERELTIKSGSRVSADSLMEVIERNRLYVFNLKIFNGVAFNIRNWENDSLDLELKVFERWYIIPFPIFKLADRNFNVWWKDYNHSFSRVQFGGVLDWKNFRGRDENLRITNTFGFFQTLDINYHVPHLSRYGKVGADFHTSYFQSRRYSFSTINDKQEFIYPDRYIIRNTDIGSKYSLTLSTHVQHYFETAYGYTWIDDSISNIHPDFLLDGGNTQHRVILEYEFVKDYRNYKAYPLSGWYFSASFRDYNLFGTNYANYAVAKARFSRYVQLAPKHFTAHLVKVQVSVPVKQPYYNQRAMGYEEDYVRGYEYYLIDGQHFLLSRNSYRFKMLDIKLNSIKFLRRTPIGAVPLLLFLNAHFDIGYVFDNYYAANNFLRNELLVGFGVGLDIVTFGEGLLRLEYTFNKDLEKGLYFHVKLPI